MAFEKSTIQWALKVKKHAVPSVTRNVPSVTFSKICLCWAIPAQIWLLLIMSVLIKSRSLFFTHKLTACLPNCLTDRLTTYMAAWLTDWLTDWLTHALNHSLLPACLHARLAAWLAAWLAACLSDYLTTWLTDYLTNWLTDSGWLTLRVSQKTKMFSDALANLNPRYHSWNNIPWFFSEFFGNRKLLETDILNCMDFDRKYIGKWLKNEKNRFSSVKVSFKPHKCFQ